MAIKDKLCGLSIPSAAMRLRNGSLAVLALLLTSCSRLDRIHPNLTRAEFPLSPVAIVPIQVEWQERGFGSLRSVDAPALRDFRDTMNRSAQHALQELEIKAVLPLDDSSLIDGEGAANLTFECELELRKILAEMTLKGSFTRYARYVKRPPLNSLGSAHFSERARRLGASAFLIMRFQAVRLSGLEYWREWIRALLLTLGTAFLDTTIAHRSYITGEILLVDGRTGRALFYNRVQDYSGSPTNTEDADGIIQELLYPLREVYREGEPD